LGFIDPLQIIRGVHLIPAFAHGRTRALLAPTVIRDQNHIKKWRAKNAMAATGVPVATARAVAEMSDRSSEPDSNNVVHEHHSEDDNQDIDCNDDEDWCYYYVNM
jgi:hypothetical protein